MILLNNIRRWFIFSTYLTFTYCKWARHAPAFGGQISQALTAQSSRVRTLRESMSNKNHKRAASSQSENPELKRQKLAEDTASLASFDFTKLPVPLITELIVNNLGAISEPELVKLVRAYRSSRPPPAVVVNAQPQVPVQPVASTSKLPEEKQSKAPVKAEPLDPLDMVIDEGEIEYEPDEINQKVRIVLFSVANFCSLCYSSLEMYQTQSWTYS